MCNYMGHRVTREQYIRLKQIEKQFGILAALDALHSGFEYADYGVIIPDDSKTDFDMEMMHWEFIPSFVRDAAALKDFRKKYTTLNAKSETLLTSKMFRDAALKRRCLLPVSHFYEWRHYKPEGAKIELAYPYVINIDPGINSFVAAIWQRWTDQDTGETIKTFALVTTAANELMEVIHNKKKRQPTFLPEDLAYEWLFGDLTEERITEIASYQLPAEFMSAYTIDKNFRTAVDPLQPFDYGIKDLELVP